MIDRIMTASEREMQALHSLIEQKWAQRILKRMDTAASKGEFSIIVYKSTIGEEKLEGLIQQLLKKLYVIDRKVDYIKISW